MVKTSWVAPDTTAPVTVSDLVSQPWFTADVRVNLSAADPVCGHGVQEIRTSLNADPEQIIPGSSGTVDIITEGCNTLNYYAVDVDANTEVSHAESICIDRTVPNVTITTPADGATYYQGTTVIADYAVTDWVSGVDTVTPTTTAGSPIDTSTTGSHTFTVTATDTAGNQRTLNYNYTVAIDSTPPAITITTPAEGTTYDVGDTVVVDFTVTDNESGIASLSSTLPNGSSIDTSSAGTFIFTVSATDNSGNSDSVTNTYTVAIPPQKQLTTSVNPPGAGSVNPDCPGGCLYDDSTLVVINTVEDNGYPFFDWTGCDEPAGYLCTMTMDADKSVTAEFDNCQYPVKRTGKGTAYADIFQDTYNGASNLDIIYTQDTVFTEDIDFNLPILVTLEGGYNCDYSGITGTTIVNGNMTVSDGVVIIQSGTIEIQ
jgi:hypothetical protein